MIPSTFFVLKFIPETKGKTLEEIEKHWQENASKDDLNNEVRKVA